MEAGLIDTWIPDVDAIPVLDDASVSLLRERVRARGGPILPATIVANLVLVASELAFNQLHHAHGGLVAVRTIERGGVPGLEIVAGDQGDGIEDPRHAFGGHGKSNTGLGVGLSSVRKLAHEVDVDVRLEQGTCIWARAFARPVARRREVGIFGRPHPEANVSGDLATFVRTPTSLALTLVDGLGHGLGARTAAMAAIRSFSKHPESPGAEILEACHTALRQTRGAVMGIAQTDEELGDLRLSGVGNITIVLARRKDSRRFEGSSFVLGLQRPLHRAQFENPALTPDAAIILFSDGITARVSFEEHPDLLREPPIVIAQETVRLYGRADDDVTVVVAR